MFMIAASREVTELRLEDLQGDLKLTSHYRRLKLNPKSHRKPPSFYPTVLRSNFYLHIFERTEGYPKSSSLRSTALGRPLFLRVRPSNITDLLAVMFLILSIAAFAFSPVAIGVSTFAPYCTTPQESVSIVLGGDSRSTFDILWSSLFTLFACTWTIQHLSIPEQRNGRDPGFWGDQKWMRKSLFRSIWWMIVTLVAPEYTLAVAAAYLGGALDSRKRLKGLAAKDGVEWTLEHGFYANMGGFAIKVKLPTRGTQGQETEDIELQAVNACKKVVPKPTESGAVFETSSSLPDPVSDPSSTMSPNTAENVDIIEEGSDQNERLTNGFWRASSLDFDTITNRKEDDLQPTVTLHLTSTMVYKLRKKGYLRRLPQMSKEKISDYSKSNFFAKGVTAVQVFATIVQIIVRYSRRLSISQLELSVAAFSVCATITYLLVLRQPKGVATITILQNDGKPLLYEDAHKICVDPRHGSFFRSVIKDQSYYLNGGIDKGISNDAIVSESSTFFCIGMFAGGAIFGALHCCAWSFKFPTFKEHLLWQIASLETAIAPGIILCCVMPVVVFEDVPEGVSVIVFLILATTLIFYVMARCFTVIEIFRSLFYLPPDAFISTWTANIPRVS